MTRLGFTYFMTEQEVDYIIEAVAMVAKHGWKLLPLVSSCLICPEFLGHPMDGSLYVRT